MTHVLIVDDDELSRKIILNMLEEMGATYTEAFDGEDALLKLEAEKFDLVILDVLMPNEDGIGVLLKARNKGLETPIVVMTGATMGDNGPSYSEYAERLGAKKGLVKPITFEKIKQALSYAA